MGKTPDYIKRNVDKYRKNRYFIQVGFEKELKERLNKAGINGTFLHDIAMKELKRIEDDRDDPDDPLSAFDPDDPDDRNDPLDQDLKKDNIDNNDVCPF